MKRCVFCLAVDDAENFGDNSNKFCTLNMVEGKLVAPIVDLDGADLASLEAQMISTIKSLFESATKDLSEDNK